MRKLMLAAVGFAAACAVGAYLLTGLWMLLLAAAALGLALGAVLTKKRIGRAMAVVLFGAAAAFIWMFAYDSSYLSTARGYDATAISGEVEVTDYSYPTDYGIAADGRLELDGKPYHIRVYLYQDGQLSPGDVVEGTLRLRYTAAGGAEEATYHQGKGIFLLGYFRDDAVVTRVADIPVKYTVAVLRRNIKNILAQIFPADTLAFAQALLLGDSSLLGYKESTDLSVSGIRHIIAVSGLHVSILYAVMIAMIGYRRVLTPIVGFSMLVLFAALAGFTPSVVRACIMQGLMLLSMIVRKEYDPPTALGFAVLVMLTVNPLTVTSVSFQLSVGCIIGILAFSGKIHAYLMDKRRLGPAKGKSLKARFTRWFVSGVSVTLSAMVITTPLSALYFGAVSLIGILTNLLTLWVVTALFCGIMAACVAGAIWLPLGKGIAWSVSWIARYVLLVSKSLASFPLAAVYTQSVYIVIWLVLCYVLAGAFLLVKCRKPQWMLGCILGSLCVAVGLSWLEPRMDPYRMTVLDVGQGQCILLQTDGKSYLVDCGGDSTTEVADLASQTLLSQGVFVLDGVILTHYDTDHAGALTNLLSRVPASRLYLPSVDDKGSIKSDLTAAYSDDICWLAPGEIFSIENGAVTLFSGEASTSDNESGLCVLFQKENCDILITGDRSSAGERALMSQTDLPDLDVLVVGHHGSKTSTCLELLSATRPELAVVSAGVSNHYGHPAQETLDRLELFGCRVLRTDWMGNIIIKG